MAEERFDAAKDPNVREETNRDGSVVAKTSRLERQLAEIVTWDLVYELRAAAALARDSGEIALENRLSSTSTHLAALLSSDANHRTPSDARPSQYWVG